MVFQFFDDARRLHHAGQHGLHPFPRRPVNLQQVRVQLFTQNQTAVKSGPMFLQIALPHTAIQSYVPSRLRGWVSSFLRELIGRATVAQHIRIPNRITVLAHGIAGVALYGIDTAILDFFHNTHMVG